MTDLLIAQKAKLKPIVQIASRLGIPRKHLELYGDFKAKLSLDAMSAGRSRRGKYVVVTGITPMHLGEGKTVTTIGLSMALNSSGKKTVACLRQPSIGPFFGIKGGGVGGGRSQVLPAEDINLHLTGDIHAVSQAHNLCAAFLDNHILRGNQLGLDAGRIHWNRVVDVNDRSLRKVRIGLGCPECAERDTGFDITAASEVMAILALSTSVGEMRSRLGRIVVGFSKSGRAVTAEDLKVAGSMALLLKDAIKPTLVQTIEGTPALIHTGPFANITHGNSSVIADAIVLRLADYVVTESGFGADCGIEKFVNIKCRASGFKPDAVVLVASVRALKAHSGLFRTVAGKPLDRNIERENLDAVEHGCVNLEKQIENARSYGVPCVVAINVFKSDTDREIDIVRRKALESGAFDCVASGFYRCGSRGGMPLSLAVTEACQGRSKFRFLYPADATLKSKIETIARKIYGAASVRYEKAAEENLAFYEKLGFGRLPVCMAKTHLSLSHDPSLKGAPKGFVLPVRDVRPSIGAGFICALCGGIQTMPSLPAHPAGESIDIDSEGRLRHIGR